MRSQRILFILICFLLINIVTPFFVFGNDEWHQVKTKNFTLIGNAKEKQIKKVGIKLEQFRESIKRLVPTLSKNSPISTTVIVFKDDETFRPYKPINKNGEITEWIAGYFQAGFDINYIALAFENKSADAFQTIFHEYTHNLIDHNIGRANIPTWLSEGLSEYYDQFSVKNDRVVSFGSRNNSHIKLLNEKSLMPLDKFFSIDYDSLRIKNQPEASLYYAQAWALTHYFMHGEMGNRKNEFDNFIKSITSNKTEKEAFSDSFQITFAELQTKLEAYINSNIINVRTTVFDKKLTNKLSISSRVLSAADLYAHLGDLYYQRNRLDESEKHLAKALKLNPESSFANATFGMLRMKQEKYVKAKIHLISAINSQNADYLTHYRNAYFLSREVLLSDRYISNYTDERSKEMRLSLNKSILLNPNFPDSYRLLGFINLVRNENLIEGIEYLKKALEISPNKQTYLLDLANLYQRNKDFDNAQIIAEQIVRNADDEGLRSGANRILSNIKQIKMEVELAKQDEKLQIKKPSKINQIDNTRNSKALTEFELEQNRLKTENEEISEVLRKPKIGEKRIVGQISKVACVNNRVFLEVLINDKIKTLQSKSLNDIKLRTYTTEMQNGLFGCNEYKEKVLSVLIYRPTKENGSKILGDVISIEFVPNDFVLATEN